VGAKASNGSATRQIRTLRSTWRGLETWHGIGLNRRASPRPYLRARGGVIPLRDSPQHLRPHRTGRPAGHGESDPIYRAPSQAADHAGKSAVARPWQRSFLGFTVRDDPLSRRCIADKAVARFKHRVRELTGRRRGISLERMIGELAPFLRGWGMGALLRFQPVARVAIAGRLDPPAPALRRPGPVEDARSALPRTPSSQCLRAVAPRGRLQPKGTMAAKLLGSLIITSAFTKARFRRLGLLFMEKLVNA
jgi:hypothetical protein